MAVGGVLTLPVSAIVDVPTPAAGKASIFIDTVTGLAYIKNSAGVSSPMTGQQTSILASDVVNSTVTIADVTGLSFAVATGSTYKFKFFLTFTSAATTTGARFSINGPASTTMAFNRNQSLTTTTSSATYGYEAYDTPAAATATSQTTTSNTCVIEGIIKTGGTSGTVIARFASEVAASAITVKQFLSYVEFQKIA